MSNENEYSTRDVSLAAYIKFKGYLLKKYRIVKNGKDGEWVFNISLDDVERLKIEYVNSDIASYEGIRRGMAKQKYV